MYKKISLNSILEDILSVYADSDGFSRVIYDELGSYSSWTVSRKFGSWPNAVDAAGIPHNFVECPYGECSNLYSNLGRHWDLNPAHYPNIEDRQYEVLTGLLMGDGSLNSYGKNSYFVCNMITKEFLEWLDDEMGVLGTGVQLKNTSKEQAEWSRRSGNNPDALKENYNPIYTWNSRCHRGFNKYQKWYESGNKKYPVDLVLTPLVLSVWFCGDGSLVKRDGVRPHIQISCSNELGASDGRSKIVDLFSDIPVSPKFDFQIFRFGVDDSEWLWDWMEGPLPGFRYKWPS